jgi:hypothetical protein
MRSSSFVTAILIIAVASATGCAVSDEPEASTVSSFLLGGVPTGVQCTNQAWRVDFYAEAGLVTRLGSLQCSCFQPQLVAGVITSNFTTLVYNRFCDFN